MNLLGRYKRSKLDLSSLGFERRKAYCDYFCTPVGAEPIGWAGVDGIHFCTIRGFDDMIFAVSPMNEPGQYVHPVAENFEDFLRLMLACSGTAAIEQAWGWDQKRFDRFLSDDPPSVEMENALMQLRKKYGLEPMPDAFRYIKGIQADFDYSRLTFSEEYYDTVPTEPEIPQPPEWKITFGSDLISTKSEDVGLEPIVIDRFFRWAGIDWYVPEFYPCDEGLTMFVLGQIDPAKVRSYREGELATREARERMEAEDPMSIHTEFRAAVNGKPIRFCGSTGLTWRPAQPGEPVWNWEARWILDHYGLSPDSAWLITKVNFRCEPVEVRQLELTIGQRPVPVSGTRFQTPGAGESVTLRHPGTGGTYTLTVDSVTRDQADLSRLADQPMEFPTHCVQLAYQIQPELDRKQYRIMDCAPSDEPRPKQNFTHPDFPHAVSIGIIGGSDGPTSVIVTRPREAEGQQRKALSSLSFDPDREVEWRIVFYETPNAPYTLRLI